MERKIRGAWKEIYNIKKKKIKRSKQESEQFWSNTWDNEKEHQRNAEWLRELPAEKDNMTEYQHNN